jgi:imidazolonepropionase-like amidohydrolase
MMDSDIKVIKAGKLIDGAGAEPLVDVFMVIEKSRIKEIGQNIPIPENAQVIDAAGKTVMPGLIDAHLHLSGLKINQMVLDSVLRSSELHLIKAIADCQAMLQAGFTTIKDCGGMNAVYLKKAKEEGTLSGLPRIVAAGYILSQTFGHGDNPFFPVDCVDSRTTKHNNGLLPALICDGVPECIKAARYALREGADFVKICTTGGVLSEKDLPTDVQFNLEEIKAIVDTAGQVGKLVTAHSQNSHGTKLALLGGVKTIEHANETSQEIIELAKERGGIFISTLTIAQSLIAQGAKSGIPEWAIQKAKSQWEVMCNSLQRINKAKAILAAGTDTGLPLAPQGINAVELELLVKYAGLTPMEAIVAATRNGATACFMGDKTGTLEAGKFADIIVVDGDPLADIRILQDINRIKLVMLEGKIEVNRNLR